MASLRDGCKNYTKVDAKGRKVGVNLGKSHFRVIIGAQKAPPSLGEGEEKRSPNFTWSQYETLEEAWTAVTDTVNGWDPLPKAP